MFWRFMMYTFKTIDEVMDHKTMGYGGAWVGALVDTWNGSPPPTTTQTHAHGVWWGLGWGHEFGLAIESLPCHLLARPTPGFKPTPMGATPKTHAQPKPPGW
ncbi:hypothetical protein Hanom_Chr04g00287441 [Helianthus anomalus]